MTRGRRRTTSPTERLPQFFVMVGCALIGFTGAWLWWLGEDTTGRIIQDTELSDPFAVQVWMRRAHVASAVFVVAVVGVTGLGMVIDRSRVRALLVGLFLCALGVGIWTGFVADWSGARLWAETVGSRFRAGLDLSNGPRLPTGLRSVRIHLAVVPLAMLILAALGNLAHRRT